MNDHPPCDHPCVLACPETCALHPPDIAPIALDDALARFDREAVRGVCDTGRYRMAYFTWGEGPPLLFIHGVADTSRSFVRPISRLSAHFRCIAYDLPGNHGDGARMRRYTYADLIDDVWALLDQLRIKQSYLLASSFGSTIALPALAARPERLPRAILQGGLALRPLRWTEYLLAQVGRLLPGTVRRLPLFERVARRVSYPPVADWPTPVWDYFLDCSGRTPISTFAYQALLLNHLDMRPLLPQVRQPVLLLCGERDFVIGPAHAEILLNGLPNAGRVIVEGCGHLPSYTHPEVMAEVIRQFLTPGLFSKPEGVTRCGAPDQCP
jgi:pimeloyl-ACP methyl ester carboxylesterase